MPKKKKEKKGVYTKRFQRSFEVCDSERKLGGQREKREVRLGGRGRKGKSVGSDQKYTTRMNTSQQALPDV